MFDISQRAQTRDPAYGWVMVFVAFLLSALAIGALPSYMLMSAGQTLSVIWFPFLETTLSIYLVAVIFGFTYSGVMSTILVCTRMMVSAGYAGRAMSITSFFGWFGMGAGGFMGGLLFDMTGDYNVSFIAAMAAGSTNLVVLALFGLRIRRQSSAASQANVSGSA